MGAGYAQTSKAEMAKLIDELEPLGFENTVKYMSDLTDEIPSNIDL